MKYQKKICSICKCGVTPPEDWQECKALSIWWNDFNHSTHLSRITKISISDKIFYFIDSRNKYVTCLRF